MAALVVIFLCTDYRSSIYTGQVTAKILLVAPQTPTIDLINDLPAYNPKASAYLLNALVQFLPERCVVLGVVDPGVGSDRAAICFKRSSRWFVGPDNGLFSRIWRDDCSKDLIYQVTLNDADAVSETFHGRDVFAPAAACLSGQEEKLPKLKLEQSITENLSREWPDDLHEIVYIDGYGNAMTGIHADSVDPTSVMMANQHKFFAASKFSDVPPNTGFWYRNSIGLVEISVNQGSAEKQFKLCIGSAVSVD